MRTRAWARLTCAYGNDTPAYMATCLGTSVAARRGRGHLEVSEFLPWFTSRVTEASTSREVPRGHRRLRKDESSALRTMRRVRGTAADMDRVEKGLVLKYRRCSWYSQKCITSSRRGTSCLNPSQSTVLKKRDRPQRTSGRTSRLSCPTLGRDSVHSPSYLPQCQGNPGR